MSPASWCGTISAEPKTELAVPPAPPGLSPVAALVSRGGRRRRRHLVHVGGVRGPAACVRGRRVPAGIEHDDVVQEVFVRVVRPPAIPAGS
jgi:hypothetical protein